MGTNATFLVDFGSNAEDSIMIELDSERNNNKSSFSAGDSVYFRVYTNASSYVVDSTDGSISNLGNSTDTFEEVIQFAFSKTSNVAKPISSIRSFSWYGISLGSVSIVGSTAPTSVSASSGSTTKFGIGKIEYIASYRLYCLNVPSGIPNPYAILITVVSS